MPTQKRVDPEDGLAYTYEDLAAFYKGKYKKAAIEAYWESCKPVKQSKGKAADAPISKAKAKVKAKTKAKAKAKAKESGARRHRVGIFMGRFNPVTKSHLLKAAELIHSEMVDEVWIMPCWDLHGGPNGEIYEVNEGVITAMDRFTMCQLGVNNTFPFDFPVRVSGMQLFNRKLRYCYDLMRECKARHPDIDFSMVIHQFWLNVGLSGPLGQSLDHERKDGDPKVCENSECDDGIPMGQQRSCFDDEFPEEERLTSTGDKLTAEFDIIVIPALGAVAADLPTFGPRLRWLEMPAGRELVKDSGNGWDIHARLHHIHEIAAAHWLAGGKSDDKLPKGLTESNADQFYMLDGTLPPGVLSFIVKQRLYCERRPLNPLMPMPFSSNYSIAINHGTFNPVTNSHLTVAAAVVHGGLADESWLVPVGPAPCNKPNLDTSPRDRYCMCHIGVSEFFANPDFPVKICGIDCFAEASAYTYDVLCQLREAYKDFPGVSFKLVIGDEYLVHENPKYRINAWESLDHNDPQKQKTVVTGPKLLEEFDVIVMTRPGFDAKETLADFIKQYPRVKYLATSGVESNLSSTEIRNRSPSELHGLTPRGVVSYMYREKLYKKK